MCPPPFPHSPCTHRNVKLGPTYFIPNLQIGSFGAITPLRSLLRNHRDLWDVAAAGPLAGGLASLALLALGLAASQPGALPKELLVPVPTQLFQVRGGIGARQGKGLEPARQGPRAGKGRVWKKRRQSC